MPYHGPSTLSASGRIPGADDTASKRTASSLCHRLAGTGPFSCTVLFDTDTPEFVPSSDATGDQGVGDSSLDITDSGDARRRQ